MDCFYIFVIFCVFRVPKVKANPSHHVFSNEHLSDVTCVFSCLIKHFVSTWF